MQSSPATFGNKKRWRNCRRGSCSSIAIAKSSPDWNSSGNWKLLTAGSPGSEFATNQLIRLLPVEIFQSIAVLTEFGKYSVLNDPSRLGDGVRNAMKSHHGIFRHEELRIFRFQRQLHFLPQQKSRVGNSIPHLRKILDCHICDGVGIYF